MSTKTVNDVHSISWNTHVNIQITKFKDFCDSGFLLYFSLQHDLLHFPPTRECLAEKVHLTNGLFTLPYSNSHADTDNCTEKVAMGLNGMAPRLVLNSHLSRSKSQSRSSGNTSEHYH